MKSTGTCGEQAITTKQECKASARALWKYDVNDVTITSGCFQWRGSIYFNRMSSNVQCGDLFDLHPINCVCKGKSEIN